MNKPQSKATFHILVIFGLLVMLLGLAPASPAQAATVTVSDCSASSGAAGRLVDVIIAAAPGDAVNFSCSGTITLAGTITLDKDLTIDGSGQAVTISGGNAVRVFIVDPGVTVTLNRLTISNGLVTGPGGGINNQGTLTLSNTTLSGNRATTGGGGIINAGILTISNSVISNNSATAGSGGGIYNSTATLTVSDSVISSNSATTAGGGIYNNTSGTVTVSNSTFSGNTGPNGGGIYNSTGAASAVTVSNSTFSGNSGTNGGGLQNRGTTSITNSTFSGNTATNRGGAMMSIGGVVTLINSTLSGNGATNGGGGFYGTGTLNFSNTIIANSTSGVECSSTTIGTNLNNLVEDGSCSAALSGDPNLGALANRGGSTPTMSLVIPSPAIDAGDNTACANNPVNNLDQRGAPRWQTQCDIGAYELDITAPWVTSFAAPATTFGLDIPITDFAAYDDFTVAGYLITQSDTQPLASDPNWSGSAPTTYHVATVGTYDLYPWVKDADGNVSSLYGSISVVVLSCTSSSITVANATDSGAGSLRQALADICPDGTITFNSGLSGATIPLASQLTIDRNLTINGSALASPISISGNNAVRVFFINSGVTVTLDSLKIINGYSEFEAGGGIYLFGGNLTLKNSTVSGCSASGGGGISNQGGNLTVENSTLSGNSALSYAGGGILSTYGFAPATLIVQNSTLSENTATSSVGGAIFNDNSSTLSVVNSTLSGNAAFNGGAIANQDSNSTMIRNSTLSGNTAANVGGGIYNSSAYAPGWWTTFGFANTIVANSVHGGDCYSSGTIGMNTNNLVEDGSCSAALSGDPDLGVLADNGGSTQTFALQVGSSAIDAGDSATCTAAPVNNRDQRGATRPTDGDASGSAACDIGAFELSGLVCGLQSAAEPTDYTFPGNVILRVTDDGTDLECLRVTDIPYSHPNATSPLKTGKYWQIASLQADRITAATSNFNANLTLPFGVADANDMLCRYTGSGWDCAASGYVANTSITRNNITQFSDWTIGDNSGPTAISLAHLTASGTTDSHDRWLALLGLLALSGLVVGYRAHRTIKP